MEQQCKSEGEAQEEQPVILRAPDRLQ